MEKTRALGGSLKGESEEEEREKIDKRLEALATQFAQLQQAANQRMRGIHAYIHYNYTHVIMCICVHSNTQMAVIGLESLNTHPDPRVEPKVNCIHTHMRYWCLYLTLQAPQPITVPTIPQFPR